MSKLKILIAAFNTPGIYAIDYLLGSGYVPENIALLTHQNHRNLALMEYAKIHGIETRVIPANSMEAYSWAKKLSPDVIFSLYYREILPNSILSIPSLGAINLHPSLLPKYRGAFSSPWVIFNGDKEAGYTYHFMTEDVDAGNILLQVKSPVCEHDTAYSLYHRTIREGMISFGSALDLVISGEKGVPQTGDYSYYPRCLPHGGLIDKAWSDEKIERFIRAIYFPPYKGAICIHNGKEVEVHSISHYRKLAEL